MIRPAIALCAVVTGGCVYYNAMWSAERFARQARSAEAAGDVGQARGFWQRAAIKAESVVVRHPRSRWADDAIVLRAEALVRGGACAQAGEALARARGLSLEGELAERTGLAAGECALAAGRPVEAESLLAPVLATRDARRLARGTYLAGRAAVALGDHRRADSLFARSTHPEAAPARVRTLLSGGETHTALVLLDSLMRRRFNEAEWTELLDSTAAAAGPGAASGVLDRLLDRGRVPTDAASRLLAADGDRRAAAREFTAAADRYARAAELAPDASVGEAAQIRRLRAVATTAATVEDLEPLGLALGRARGAAGEYRGLTITLGRIRERDSDVAAFRAAELARDSLQAATLAGHLFLEVASRWPTSVFAPKALVAAMTLLPEQRDSLAAVLDGPYAASPYAQALRGEGLAAFVAAEDSLARALGVTLAVEARPMTARVGAPRPGPRTVWLEPPSAATPAATEPGPPARRAVSPTRPPQRPGDRPLDRP